MPSLSIPTRRHFITRNGVRLHVVEAGPEDGDLVVLLHGFPEFWYGWRHQISALAEAGYRVVVPDQRGYNRSDAPSSVAAYDLERLVGDVQAVLDACEADRAHIAGHDWGAVVAWALAAWHPEHVRRLAILNVPHPAVFQKTLTSSLEQLRRSWYIFFFQLPRLPEWVLSRNDFGGLTRMLRGSSHAGTFSDDDLAAYRRAWRRPGRLQAMIHWYRAAARRTVFGGRPIGRIEPETLVLWGAQDVALTPQMARPSVERCRRGRLEMFEDATHWVQHDAADRVNTHLLQFLTEL